MPASKHEEVTNEQHFQGLVSGSDRVCCMIHAARFAPKVIGIRRPLRFENSVFQLTQGD
jgi:hypothetical protein